MLGNNFQLEIEELDNSGYKSKLTKEDKQWIVENINRRLAGTISDADWKEFRQLLDQTVNRRQ